MNNTIKEQLLTVVGSDCLIENAPMKDQVSFRVGGAADFLVMPEKIEELTAILQILKENNQPYTLMGNGSNLLVKDGGYRGTIIKTRSMDHVEVRENLVIAEAGAMLRKVAEAALKHELTGMEFASGIPGTIGGATVMNAGAYNGEMKDIITTVDYLTAEGEMKTIAGADCGFGYRQSIFQQENAIVLRVTLQLCPGKYADIQAQMKELNGRRRDKQPLEYPSAGSTFRRPEGYFAGKLIQDSGLKGFGIGGAQVSEKHAGFIINRDHATAKDVTDLIAHVQQTVKENFGVDLQREVIIIGEEA